MLSLQAASGTATQTVTEVFAQLHIIGQELERLHPNLYTGVCRQVTKTFFKRKRRRLRSNFRRSGSEFIILRIPMTEKWPFWLYTVTGDNIIFTREYTKCTARSTFCFVVVLVLVVVLVVVVVGKPLIKLASISADS
jgi:hypothetical protein